MVEQIVAEPAPNVTRAAASSGSRPRRLREIEGDAEERWRVPLGEFSRVLGGGVVPGSLVLIGGDPGIGKSTLLLQVASALARDVGRVLYVSGEESERQIKMRAQRLVPVGDNGSNLPEDLFLLTETDLQAILGHVEMVAPRVLVIDSIQTAYLSELTSSAGSVSQVRECAARLQALAKSSGIAVFLIGHVTKEGAIAGPRVLEHIVDTVLYLEGDRFQSFRLLRAVKNRFGATSEVGVFEMQSAGMIEVPNPSEAFLAERVLHAPGSAIAVTMEGTRPLLVELQGLTSASTFGNPRRTPNGVDLYRLLLVTAVLSRRVGMHLADQDIFINVVGGLRVDEPAADLAMAVAIASSMNDRPVAADLALVGEVGLSGELRAIPQVAARVREAAQLGFGRILVPRTVRQEEAWPKGIQVIAVRSLREAIERALGEPAEARSTTRGSRPGTEPEPPAKP
ncbi:MAG: DNA repair protein RadA [Chloroflexi bacterium RBG_16_64_43]|nr:MAG: DNA repair protein RadA [Chloroflexi bacterium RBG_16_64_43]